MNTENKARMRYAMHGLADTLTDAKSRQQAGNNAQAAKYVERAFRSLVYALEKAELLKEETKRLKVN